MRGGSGNTQEDGDWEVEMVSAIVEALDREVTSEEVGKSHLSLSTRHLLRMT